ncbi:MAG: ribosome maturation factor RimM [Candidatus Kapaibacterium sp.]
MALRYIGTITGSRGVEGAIMLRDVPNELKSLPEGITVKIGYTPAFARDYTLYKFKSMNRGAIVRLREVQTREQARDMKEFGIFIDEEDIRRANEKIIFEDELIGSDVIDLESGESIGKVVEVLDMPANDVWIVDTDRGELPLPVTDEVIKKVDKENKIIHAQLPDGIWDLAMGGGNE